MLVKLTALPLKTELYLRCEDIRSITRNPENIMESVVSVNIMTPKGPLGYLVMEGPDTIASQIAAGGWNKVTN